MKATPTIFMHGTNILTKRVAFRVLDDVLQLDSCRGAVGQYYDPKKM